MKLRTIAAGDNVMRITDLLRMAYGENSPQANFYSQRIKKTGESIRAETGSSHSLTTFGFVTAEQSTMESIP
jgi:hypothetical protein